MVHASPAQCGSAVNREERSGSLTACCRCSRSRNGPVPAFLTLTHTRFAEAIRRPAVLVQARIDQPQTGEWLYQLGR